MTTTRTTLLFFAAIGLAAAAGCYTGPNSDLSPGMRGPETTADGTSPVPGADGTTSGDAAVAADGLPCDVAKVLQTSCVECHGARLSGGAPNSLLTYEDLAAPSKTEVGKTVAEASVARMKATKEPMPPDGRLAPAEVAILEKWVGAGMPRGACGGKSSATGGGDAGRATDGSTRPADAAVPPAPTVCTSGTTWPQGAASSALMHPGKPCISCHSATGGPSFVIAGTVYPTIHEPDDCNGSGTGNLSVLIIDATGKTHTMPVNAAGNFTRVTSIPLPYRAMIVDGAKVREMKTPQTDGDCNGCHSEAGNHAPGRVMAP